MAMEPSVDQVVWAKARGFDWWPAQIFDEVRVECVSTACANLFMPCFSCGLCAALPARGERNSE